MLYTEDELKMRYQAVDYAIATQRLEGLELDSQTVEDLRCEARGEMTMDEIRANLFKKIKKGEF